MADAKVAVRHLIALVRCAQDRLYDAEFLDGDEPDGLRDAARAAKEALRPYAVMDEDVVWRDPDA